MAEDHWIVRSGCWLTKRRGVLLAPLFTAALISARPAPLLWLEVTRDLIGLACLAGGTWLRLLAASYHDSSHHAEPITAGPYAWVRHPLYLANFLLGLGIVLVTGWWPIVTVYVLVFLPLHFVIARSEEVHLIQLYGRTYEDYLRSVPAILPWKRFTGTRYGSRSGFKLEKGKEGLKVVGYLAGVAAILMVKYWRQTIWMPSLQPLPLGVEVLAAATAILAVILRPRLRSKWLRISQTIIAVGCTLLIVVHLRGVLPAARKRAPPLVPKQELSKLHPPLGKEGAGRQDSRPF